MSIFDTFVSHQKKLTKAVLDGDLSNVRSLLEHKFNINDKIYINITPLHLAVLKCTHERKEVYSGIVKTLLEAGANTNVPDEESGVTPLMLAVGAQQLEVGELLLSHGANLELKDSKGRTALLIACQKHNFIGAKFLIKHGAETNVQEEETGVTPLMLAVGAPQLEVGELLLSHGANLELKDSKGRTALRIACQKHNFIGAKFLTEHDAIIDPDLISNEAADRMMPPRRQDRLQPPTDPPHLDKDIQGQDEPSSDENGYHLKKDAPEFSVYHHKEVKPKVWYTMLVYIHLLSALKAVKNHSQSRLGQQAKDFSKSHGQATRIIERGAEIMIVPELPGCRFNPKQVSLQWLEDWHCAEFHLQAVPDLQGFEPNSAVNGRVIFYVGPIIVGEVKIWAYFADKADTSIADQPNIEARARPYQDIFVSYSHKDTLIVDKLESAYTVLGMQYIRDVGLLRSGEKWNPVLLEKIQEADIFQLCWSSAAKSSHYVEHEWRHALKQARSSFIRPVYWQKPMPKPPEELTSIHFSYLELV